VRIIVDKGRWISVLINSKYGGKLPNQTLSAHNWELKKSGKRNFVRFIDILLLWYEDDHCMNSWIYWKLCEVEKDDCSRYGTSDSDRL
jgi:hypothetical protein